MNAASCESEDSCELKEAHRLLEASHLCRQVAGGSHAASGPCSTQTFGKAKSSLLPNPLRIALFGQQCRLSPRSRDLFKSIMLIGQHLSGTADQSPWQLLSCCMAGRAVRLDVTNSLLAVWQVQRWNYQRHNCTPLLYGRRGEHRKSNPTMFFLALFCCMAEECTLSIERKKQEKDLTATTKGYSAKNENVMMSCFWK